MVKKHQVNGAYDFENERGYMAGMLGGLNLMVDTLHQAADIIATYHHELAEAKNYLNPSIKNASQQETAILTCIAKCCQDLDQHRLFFDGNIRTAVFVVKQATASEWSSRYNTCRAECR